MTVRRNVPRAQEQKNNSTVACDKVRIMGTSEKADINTWNAEAAADGSDGEIVGLNLGGFELGLSN